MDISIIKEQDGVKDFGGIKSDDVVILPAFGASLQEMMLLSDRGVNIVDTTCPWVAKVRDYSIGHPAIACCAAPELICHGASLALTHTMTLAGPSQLCVSGLLLSNYGLSI